MHGDDELLKKLIFSIINVKNLIVSKTNFKSLMAEKEALITCNNVLHEKLQELEKKFSKEQALEEKNNVTKAENKDLSAYICTLQDQVERPHNILQGEKVLGIMYDSLKVVKNTLRQNDACCKQL